MTNSIKSIADLTPDPKNARKHNPRNIAMISRAIGEVGVGRSIVIDEDGNILAGNGTVEALAECGITDVKVIQANGNEVIAVQRTGLTEEQKKKLALYDNRTGELAEWEPEILQELNIEMPDLLENMFMPLELDDILAPEPEEPGYSEGEDDVPDAVAEPITKQGDIWQLGNHRLMCGDSTDKQCVDTLMAGNKADALLTDPPYGIGEGKKHTGRISPPDERWRNRKLKEYKSSEWDEKPISPEHLALIRDSADHQIIFGGNYYDLPPTTCYLVWDKDNGNSDFADCELAWTNLDKAIRRIKYLWNGFQKAKPEERFHPTQKPVGVMEWCIGHLPEDCKTIFDPFGGSGSTLIACEKLDRKCYMMEIDPSYCDVIVKRWEEFTGNKAELI